MRHLFDDMMAYVTDSKGVVLARNYVLGVSMIGFVSLVIFATLSVAMNIYGNEFIYRGVGGECKRTGAIPEGEELVQGNRGITELLEEK